MDFFFSTYSTLQASGLLPVVALILVIGSAGLYLWRVMNGLVLRTRPFLTEGLVLLGTLLSVITLFQSPGWVGGSVAALTVLVGGAFIWLMSQGPLPSGVKAKIGEQAFAFSLSDWDGQNYEFVPGQSGTTLLKFYRGHW